MEKRLPRLTISIIVIFGLVGMIAYWIPAKPASQLESTSALRTDGSSNETFSEKTETIRRVAGY